MNKKGGFNKLIRRKSMTLCFVSATNTVRKKTATENGEN